MSVLIAAATGCDLIKPGIPGSGKIVTEQRTVSGMSGVVLEGTGQVTIDVGNTESLSITADDNLMSYLTSDVRNGELVLGTKNGENIDPSKDVVYKLTLKDLNAISLSGSGSIDARGIHTTRLKVALSGSGEMKAAGTADEEEITLSGSGEYRAEDVKSKNASVTISGSGGAELSVSDKLNVSISGSGNVTYRGDPMVTQQIAGSGSVSKR